MTVSFQSRVDRVVGKTLARFDLTLDEAFDGTDSGGRALSICYYRGRNCKLQIYYWEREFETNCMIAPVTAPNEFGLLSESKQWQFLTKFVARSDRPIDEAVFAAAAEYESHAEPLEWVRDRIDTYYEKACISVTAEHTLKRVPPVPVSGADAVYRGQRYRIAFSGPDWVALLVDSDIKIPDAFERGDTGRRETSNYRTWAKVPRSTLEAIFHVRSTGTIQGHEVLVRQQLSDGRVGVEYVGPPAVAKGLGMKGDQHQGWTGVFAPEDFDDITVEETRRA